LLILALGGGAFYAGHWVARTELLVRHPPADLRPVLPSAPSVLLRIDLNQPRSKALFAAALKDEAAILREFILNNLPYAGVLALTPRRDREIVEVVFGMSMPRFAALLDARADTGLWRWWHFQEVDSARCEAPGLWVARSHWRISPGAQSEAQRRWRGSDSPPVPLESEYPLSFVLDNRAGGAYLALETWLNPPPALGDLPARASPAWNAESIAAWMARLRTATGALDIQGSNAAEFRVTIVAASPEAAASLAEDLRLMRERLEARWAADDVKIRGDFAPAGDRIETTLRIDNIEKPFIREWRLLGL
jgi:hypothetical protein